MTKKAIIRSTFFILSTAAVTYLLICRVNYPAIKQLEEAAVDGMLQGALRVKANKRHNKYVIFRYAIPIDANGKAKMKNGNWIFYAPFNGEAKSIAMKLPEWAVKIAAKSGCGIFSISIEVDNREPINDKSYYVSEKSGWPELIWKTFEKFCRQNDFAIKNLFLIGKSSGGTMAYNMLNLRADIIRAAAWCGGTNLHKFAEPEIEIPILAINTWGCHGMTATKKVFASLSGRGYPIMHMVTRPHFDFDKKSISHHDSSPASEALIEQFIVDMVELQNDKGSCAPVNWKMHGSLAGKNQILPSERFKEIAERQPFLTEMGANGIQIFRSPGEKDSMLVLFREKIDLHGNIHVMDELNFIAEHGGMPVFVPFKQLDSEETIGGRLQELLALEESLQVDIYGIVDDRPSAELINAWNGISDKRLKTLKILYPQDYCEKDEIWRSKVDHKVFRPVHTPARSFSKEWFSLLLQD